MLCEGLPVQLGLSVPERVRLRVCVGDNVSNWLGLALAETLCDALWLGVDVGDAPWERDCVGVCVGVRVELGLLVRLEVSVMLGLFVADGVTLLLVVPL